MGTRNRERRRVKKKAREQQYQRRQVRQGVAAALPEFAGQLVANAVDARHDGDAAALADCLRLMAEGLGGPFGPDGRRAVDRAVLHALDMGVELSWQRGWQPADLVRVVRRQLGKPHHARMAVDAMAAQMRRYAPATVDERWAAQLKDLGAVAWWAGDDEYLAAWGEREGLDREAVLGSAVDLVAVLDTLPSLPRLCPLPGAARRLPRASRQGVDQRMLDRVRALLAKAESTGFPEEAETYTAKAQELMARYSIDYALLAVDSAGRDEPTGRRVGVDNPYEAAKAMLLDVVARANRCRSVWSQQLGFSTVVGYPGDLDAVELLYTSLLVQGTAAMVQAGSRRDVSGRSRTRSFRQSFLTAYAVRIGERLTAATERVSRQVADESADGRLLPVLAARDHSVRAAVETLFPETVARHVGRVADREGWASGTAAADFAALGIGQELPADG